jgi:ribonuclease HII
VIVCGVDEAGRGPVLGPLVICGVSVDDEQALVKLGVKDSKQLSPKRREELAGEIRRLAKRVEIVVLEADEIDRMRRHRTMNQIEARLFAEVINRMSAPKAIVDAADASERKFARMVQKGLAQDTEIHSKHKADQLFPVVSAASIIAKVERDSRVRAIEEEIGEPIGSGYQTDETTMCFLENYIKKNGRCPPHTRTSWEPAQKLMTLKHLRRLESFEE